MDVGIGIDMGIGSAIGIGSGVSIGVVIGKLDSCWPSGHCLPAPSSGHLARGHCDPL